MIACAFGPGRLVFRSGPVMPSRASFLLPARPGGIVLEEDAAIGKLVADAVGGGEITPLAGRLAFLDQPLDLLDRHRWLRVFGAAKADHAEHLVELVDRRRDQSRLVATELTIVDRLV